MVGSPPTFLTEVMDTIATLRDNKGSPPDRILDKLVANSRTPIRNASLQIKKALKTGLKTGLLKEVGGKFKLGLAPKDYAIFRHFRTIERGGGSSLPIREMRRRGKRRGRGRRKGKRRRRSDFLKMGLDGERNDDSEVFADFKAKSGAFPVKELRGRRGKGRRRKGKRRRRTEYYDFENAGDTDSGDEPEDRGRRRKRKRRGKKRGGRRRGMGMEEEANSPESSESKEVKAKSSDEKPKTAKGQGRGELGGGNRYETDKRELVPDRPRSRMDQDDVRSNHCMHDYPYHQEGPYTHHPPPHPNHYGGEHYYD